MAKIREIFAVQIKTNLDFYYCHTNRPLKYSGSFIKNRIFYLSCNINNTSPKGNNNNRRNEYGTRMALASVLGPFGVHLLTFTLPTPLHWGYWNFRLEFVISRISQHTRDLSYLSCDCDLWKHLVFRLLLAILIRLVGLSKQKDLYWTISHRFHVRSRNALLKHYEVHELDGYNYEFWKTGIFFEMSSSYSPQLHTRKFHERHPTRLGSSERLRIFSLA